MKYYQEVRLIPDAEVGFSFLWSKVYMQIHLALADYQNKQGFQDIGVSFPDYHYDGSNPKQNSVGRRLHIFGNSTEALVTLSLRAWLKRLEDYAPLSEIATNEEENSHAIYSRFQPKNNAAMRRSIRRRIEKSGETNEQAVALMASYTPKKTTLPCIHLESQTNQNKYQVYIKKTDTSLPSDSQLFTTYGLSKSGSTVPAV